MAIATSLVSLIRESALRLYAGGGRAEAVLGVTTALGSITTLVDDVRLRYTGADANKFDGVYVRIDENPGGGPASGEFSRVTVGGLAPTTGILTLSPPLTAAIPAGADYSLHLIHPNTLREAANWALGQLRRIRYSPVSMLPDADMEETGTGEWISDGTSTVSKQTGTPNVYAGKQSLRVANAGANGYARQADIIPVVPSSTMFISAISEAENGTARLLVRDDTAGVTIKSADNVLPGFNDLSFTFSIPAGCEHLQIRLQGLGAADFPHWDDVILLDENGRWYNLPPWVERADDVMSVFYFPRGQSGSGAADNYELDESLEIPWPGWHVRSNMRASTAKWGPLRLELDYPASHRLYFKAWERYETLTTDADTTQAPKDVVLAGMRIYLRKILKETAIMEHDSSLVAVLAAFEKEDNDIWTKAREVNDGMTQRGLRKYGHS